MIMILLFFIIAIVAAMIIPSNILYETLGTAQAQLSTKSTVCLNVFTLDSNSSLIP
jgi:hypothetical protein